MALLGFVVAAACVDRMLVVVEVAVAACPQQVGLDSMHAERAHFAVPAVVLAAVESVVAGGIAGVVD